jgi:excisionase family DNA binding protein
MSRRFGESTRAKPNAAHSAPLSADAVSVRLPKMCEILGISETKGKELIRTGKVRSVKLGKTRLISVESIRDL